MRRMYTKFVLITLSLVLLAGGCNLLFGRTYDVEITNYAGYSADVHYRLSGDTEWEYLTSLIDGGVAYEALDEGTYDFRAVVALADVNDEGAVYGTASDCVLDFDYDLNGDGQTYDYNLYIRSDSLSFY